MTLKQSQGHQTYNDTLDPEQGYSHAKFERSRVNMSQKKVTLKFLFSKRVNMSKGEQYEWVMLSEYYYHAKIDIYHIYSV